MRNRIKPEDVADAAMGCAAMLAVLGGLWLLFLAALVSTVWVWGWLS